MSDGTIIINDTTKQQQNVDDLSRDVAHANQTLSPIFNKEKEQQRMQTLQLIGEVGNQAADIARTQGDIAGVTAAKAEHPTYTDDQLRETVEFKQASQPFGTGGDIQRAITASTAAIQGLAGGDIAKALAGGAAPYLAEEIHKRTTTGDKVNIPANLMAHAVVNAALSLAKGENALAGASSAVTAEAVGLISKSYYDKKPSELDESQKQTISALASLAAGLAGGLVGGDTASAVSGMQTGKVTVENNALGDNKPGHDDNELKREHGDRELKVISMKPWTGSLLDENGNPIPGAYKAGSVMPVTGKGTSSTTKPSSSGKGSSQAETKPSSDAENAVSQSEGKLPWSSWQSYPKQAVDGRQYAKIGDRFYSQHAVDRMQPSGLGSPAGTSGPGRNITPNIVEHTIKTGTPQTSISNGVPRTVYWSGDVGVVTENKGNVIVTILRRSGQ